MDGGTIMRRRYKQVQPKENVVGFEYVLEEVFVKRCDSFNKKGLQSTDIIGR